MTDKKSVVSTPALPDLGCGWSLVPGHRKPSTDGDITDDGGDNVDVQVTDDQAERDDRHQWRGWHGETV